MLVKSLITRLCRLHIAYCSKGDGESKHCGGDPAEACPFDKEMRRCPDRPYCSDLTALSEHIEVHDDATFWVDPYRYSNPQETWMNTGGLVGGVTYRGDLTPFIPLLKMGERINVGKMTTMGLGKIDIAW